MIDSLTIKPCKNSEFPWVAELDYFKRHPVTEFKPGLNILFGGNGSGKSTVLQLLAQSLAAAQGGVSMVTTSWLQDVFGFDGKELLLPCEVVHDGQPVMFFDARAQEGLIGGSFDDDFFSLGIENIMAKGSAGQLGLRRLERLLRVMHPTPEAPPAQAAQAAPDTTSRGRTAKDFSRKAPNPRPPADFPAQIEWKMSRGSVNSAWTKRLDLAEELFRAKRPLGQKTLIFDEPESGFSLPWQAGLWSNVFAKVDPERFQVIVATHSPFALRIPGANYIEMSPDYLLESQLATLSLVDRYMKGA